MVGAPRGVARLPAGQDAFAREVALQGGIGAFEFHGQSDFLQVLAVREPGPPFAPLGAPVRAA